MTFFSTPELLQLDNIPFISTNIRPTRIEVMEYYRKVVEYRQLNLQLHTKVTSISKGKSFFKISTCDHKYIKSTHVVVATGYFDNTNRVNVEGEDLAHETHYYGEP